MYGKNPATWANVDNFASKAVVLNLLTCLKSRSSYNTIESSLYLTAKQSQKWDVPDHQPFHWPYSAGSERSTSFFRHRIFAIERSEMWLLFMYQTIHDRWRWRGATVSNKAKIVLEWCGRIPKCSRSLICLISVDCELVTKTEILHFSDRWPLQSMPFQRWQ